MTSPSVSSIFPNSARHHNEIIMNDANIILDIDNANTEESQEDIIYHPYHCDDDDDNECTSVMTRRNSADTRDGSGQWSLSIPSVAYQVDSMYAAEFHKDSRRSLFRRRQSSLVAPCSKDQDLSQSHRRRRRPTVHMVRWTFGFANKEALSRGESGASCLGDEHEIILEWNISSGLYAVYFDSVQIKEQTRQISPKKNNNNNNNKHRLVICFDLPRKVSSDHHIVHIFGVHKKSFLGSWNAKFDMRINGQSFVDMLKVRQLGMTSMDGADF